MTIKAALRRYILLSEQAWLFVSYFCLGHDTVMSWIRNFIIVFVIIIILFLLLSNCLGRTRSDCMWITNLQMILFSFWSYDFLNGCKDRMKNAIQDWRPSLLNWGKPCSISRHLIFLCFTEYPFFSENKILKQLSLLLRFVWKDVEVVEVEMAARCRCVKFICYRILSLLWEINFPAIWWVNKPKLSFCPKYGGA